MGIDYESHVDIESVSEHHIRCLPRHSSEREQVLHGAGDLTVVLLDDAGHRLMDRLRFAPIESDRFDIRLDLLRRRARVRLRGLERLEKLGGCLVDTGVRGLCGKYRRDQEFVRVRVRQLAIRIGVVLLERIRETLRTPLLSGCRLGQCEWNILEPARVVLALRMGFGRHVVL